MTRAKDRRSAGGNTKKEKALEEAVRAKLTMVFLDIDVDGSGKISQNEFELMKDNEEIVECFETMGIEPQHLMSMSDSIFGMDDEEVLEAMRQAESQAESQGTRVSISNIDTMKERLKTGKWKNTDEMSTIVQACHMDTRMFNSEISGVVLNLADCLVVIVFIFTHKVFILFIFLVSSPIRWRS